MTPDRTLRAGTRILACGLLGIIVGIVAVVLYSFWLKLHP
jgi:hypothetical protein